MGAKKWEKKWGLKNERKKLGEILGRKARRVFLIECIYTYLGTSKNVCKEENIF